MKRLITLLVAATFGVPLTSCSGATSRASLPSMPARYSQRQPHKDSGIRLLIRIPRRHSRRRHAKYVSPNTASIAITLTQHGSSKTLAYNYDLSPTTNPSCTASPITCNLFIRLAPGRYEASFATFDGGLDAYGNPTGNELSANQLVAFVVAAGTANTISVILGGIPASLVLVPSATSQLIGNSASGYSLTRCGAGRQNVSMLAADADGNLILGAGAPALSLSSDSGSLVVTRPSAKSPQFLLTPPAPPSYAFPGLIVHLAARAEPIGGTGTSELRQLINVTFTSNLCGVFTEFNVPTPMSSPQTITVGSDGALWFTENAANKIGRIPTTATAANPQIIEYPVPSANSHPFAITSGADGALWFTECYPGNIARMPVTGSPIYEFPIPTPNSAPQGIASGADSNIWFTEAKGNKIGNVPTEGTISIKEFPVPTPSSLPFAITPGPDGGMWFVESVGNKIGRIPLTATTASPQITEYAVPTASSFPRGIALGPDVALWFSEGLGNRIGRVAPGGSISEFPVPATGQPKGITTGPDGDLWAVENTGNSLLQIPLSGSSMDELAIPTSDAVFGDPSIVQGPDGSLWFTEVSANKIGRLQ